MATAKQLVNQAFGPQAQARRWATGVRTGWAIFGALLHQVGGGGGTANLPFLRVGSTYIRIIIYIYTYPNRARTATEAATSRRPRRWAA
jgi:hypothetical protein